MMARLSVGPQVVVDDAQSHRDHPVPNEEIERFFGLLP